MENLKITSNKSARTFTIRKLENNKVYAKFRTYQFDKEEFNNAIFWTENDWRNWLKTNAYKRIK
jgi:hypothetical protein